MRSLSFTRDEYFKLSVLMRMMNSTHREAALVAGCTVAFPPWWRFARRTGIFLICVMHAYAGLLNTRVTRSAISGVLLDPVSFILFLVLWISITACLEASIYPSLKGYLIARNETLYSGFISGMGAYVACGWRAAGPHFAYPGVITLVAVFWHCWYASIYPSDNKKLQQALDKDYEGASMGDWLYTSNFYRPELQSLKMPRWKKPLDWVGKSNHKFRNKPTLKYDQTAKLVPSAFCSKLEDRPVVECDSLDDHIPVSKEQALKLVNLKVPLVFLKEEAKTLCEHRQGNPEAVENGEQRDHEEYFKKLMDEQPSRQTKLKPIITDIGRVVDFPFLFDAREGTAYVVLGLLALGLAFALPTTGSKFVFGGLAAGFAHFADFESARGWTYLQQALLEDRAGIRDPGTGCTSKLGLLQWGVLSIIGVALEWLSSLTDESSSGWEHFVTAWVHLAACAVVPVVITTAWGTYLTWDARRARERRARERRAREDDRPGNGTWIQPNGTHHGYSLFMQNKETNFDHSLGPGDAYVVGSHRLLFSDTGGEWLNEKVGTNGIKEGHFSVEKRGNFCLVQVG
ncbi:unnamed protein product [Ectocarpus sp. CCAP 1310/34]|nr:unnamed protein product [Ectocarpus sp. CCAP 1310/34]